MPARLLACLLLALLAPPRPLLAQTTPATIARDAGIDPRVGGPVPTDLAFRDESGQAVRLGRYFGEDRATPAILVPAYYTCPDLCPMTLRHLTEGLNGIALRAGRDFRVVIVSFDPRDTPAIAASRKTQYLRAYRSGAANGAAEKAADDGWHFLTGPQESIDRLKGAVGYRCTFDAGRGRFAHAAGVMVVTPGGRLSHYFFGTDYSPADLEAALKDATMGRATSASRPDRQDREYCFAYDPRAGKYGRIITHVLQAGGALWLMTLLGYIGLKLAREFHGAGGAGAAACAGPAGRQTGRGQEVGP